MAGTFSLVALYAMVLWRVRDPMMGWMAALALASLFQWLTADGAGLSGGCHRSAWMDGESAVVVAYELAFCSFYFYLSACQMHRVILESPRW